MDGASVRIYVTAVGTLTRLSISHGLRENFQNFPDFKKFEFVNKKIKIFKIDFLHVDSQLGESFVQLPWIGGSGRGLLQRKTSLTRT